MFASFRDCFIRETCPGPFLCATEIAFLCVTSGKIEFRLWQVGSHQSEGLSGECRFRPTFSLISVVYVGRHVFMHVRMY